MHVVVLSGILSNTGKTTISLALAMYVTHCLNRKVIYIDLDWINRTGTKILRSQLVKVEKGVYRLEPPDVAKLPSRGIFDLLAGGRLDVADLYTTRLVEKASPVLLIGPGSTFRQVRPDAAHKFMKMLSETQHYVIWDFPVLETKQLLMLKPVIENLDLVIFPAIPGKEQLTDQEIVKIRQLANATVVLVHNMVTREDVKGREKIPEIRVEARNLEEKIYNIARRIYRKYLQWIRTYIH